MTETMVIPSGALGMEALREIAARYRLRYLLLYREVVAKETSLNPWAWGYATVIGAFFLPGQRQDVYGYIEASMFDVKTGLLMFTTRRSVSASQHANRWRKRAKMEQLAANVTSKFAPDLATDVLADLRRFASAALAENAKRGGAPMVAIPGRGRRRDRRRPRTDAAPRADRELSVRTQLPADERAEPRGRRRREPERGELGLELGERAAARHVAVEARGGTVESTSSRGV